MTTPVIDHDPSWGAFPLDSDWQVQGGERSEKKEVLSEFDSNLEVNTERIGHCAYKQYCSLAEDFESLNEEDCQRIWHMLSSLRGENSFKNIEQQCFTKMFLDEHGKFLTEEERDQFVSAECSSGLLQPIRSALQRERGIVLWALYETLFRTKDLPGAQCHHDIAASLRQFLPKRSNGGPLEKHNKIQCQNLGPEQQLMGPSYLESLTNDDVLTSEGRGNCTHWQKHLMLASFHEQKLFGSSCTSSTPIHEGPPEEMEERSRFEESVLVSEHSGMVDFEEMTPKEVVNWKVGNSEHILNSLCWFPFGFRSITVGCDGGTFILENSPDHESEMCTKAFTFLEVPLCAVEEGETAYIHYGITPAGPFSFPDGYKLCSMVVYLVVRGAKLKKPMILHLPHWCCEDGAQKTSSEDRPVKCCWSPHILHGDQKVFDFSFMKEDSYVVNAVAGVIQIRGDNCLFANVCNEEASEYYQAHVFKEKPSKLAAISSELPIRHVCIAITLKSATWRQIMEKYYKPHLKGKWTLRHCLAPFRISNDTLSYRLTLNGEALNQKEERDWTISHVGACSIEKSLIGDFSKDENTLKHEVETLCYPPAFLFDIYEKPCPGSKYYSQTFRTPKLVLTEVNPPVEIPITVSTWKYCNPRQHARTPLRSLKDGNSLVPSRKNLFSSPSNQAQCHNSSLSFHYGNPSQKTIQEFLDSFKDKFLEVVAAKDIASKLENKKILPPAKATAIAGMNATSEARSCLYHHVHEQADYEVAKSLCEIMVKEEGYRNMNKLGKEMLKYLEQISNRTNCPPSSLGTNSTVVGNHSGYGSGPSRSFSREVSSSENESQDSGFSSQIESTGSLQAR